MKKAILIFIALNFLVGCKSITGPNSETTTTTTIPKQANIIIDGNISTSLTTYGCPQFTGYVKNTGNNTAYNCMVEIQCFSDSAKTTIIDTAFGFPASLGDIGPGIRAYFEAVAFACTSHDQIKGTTVKITWLER